MVTISDLKLVKISTTKKGIYVFAKYPNWAHEYSFLIQNDGKVQGRTTSGFWVDVSNEIASLIQSKIQPFLISALEFTAS